MIPQIRYTKSGDVSIAYQVFGQGPLDLVYIPGWVSNIEIFWEEPALARFLTRMASFCRLILFDKRGTGLSDRVAEMPSLEVRMDDARAVLDAIRLLHRRLARRPSSKAWRECAADPPLVSIHLSRTIHHEIGTQ